MEKVGGGRGSTFLSGHTINDIISSNLEATTRQRLFLIGTLIITTVREELSPSNKWVTSLSFFLSVITSPQQLYPLYNHHLPSCKIPSSRIRVQGMQSILRDGSLKISDRAYKFGDAPCWSSINGFFRGWHEIPRNIRCKLQPFPGCFMSCSSWTVSEELIHNLQSTHFPIRRTFIKTTRSFPRTSSRSSETS